MALAFVRVPTELAARIPDWLPSQHTVLSVRSLAHGFFDLLVQGPALPETPNTRVLDYLILRPTNERGRLVADLERIIPGDEPALVTPAWIDVPWDRPMPPSGAEADGAGRAAA